MPPRFSLRRSLCALLLVAVAATSFADWTTSQINSNLSLLQSVYDILRYTQNSDGLTSAYYLQTISGFLDDNLPSLKTSVQSQTSALSSLNSTISDISTLVASIENSMSSSTNVDFSDITSRLDSIHTAISSYSSYVSSINILLSSLSSSQVTSSEFGSSISNVVNSLSSVTTYQQLSSMIDGLTTQINAISSRLESTLDVSGDVEISSTSFAPVVNAVGQLQQKVFDFQTNFLQWYVGRTDGHYNEHTWIDFANKFDGFLTNFDSLLVSIQWIYSYMNGTFQEQFSDVWTNTITYLPFLTNSSDSTLSNYLTNNFSKIFMILQDNPSDIFDPIFDDIEKFRLAYLLSLLSINQGREEDSPPVQSWVPSSTSDPGATWIKRWFQGTWNPLTPAEHDAGGIRLSSVDDQRRYIFAISNTVPYIEGLPYRRASLSETGDGWLGAWGNYNWNTDGDTISLIEDSRPGGHSPWNNNYFSTDYFADLFKFISRTNLLQDAYYAERILEALGYTNNVDDIDIPEDAENSEFQEPTDLDSQLDNMTPENFFPTEFSTIHSSSYDTFESESQGKLAYALDSPVADSESTIVVFPEIGTINGFASPTVLDLANYMTDTDRRQIRNTFVAIWNLVYYLFVVLYVNHVIRDFFKAS